MINPTIGRQVWYFPTLFERRLGEQPFAATVVYVHSDRYVNLEVLGHRGERMVKESVRLVQEGESAPEEKGHCEWMPFQKGQAKAITTGPDPLQPSALDDLVHRVNSQVSKAGAALIELGGGQIGKTEHLTSLDAGQPVARQAFTPKE